MSEKRTKAEKLQQQIERAEKAIHTLPDETATEHEDAKHEDANQPTVQVLRELTQNT